MLPWISGIRDGGPDDVGHDDVLDALIAKGCNALLISSGPDSIGHDDVLDA